MTARPRRRGAVGFSSMTPGAMQSGVKDVRPAEMAGRARIPRASHAQPGLARVRERAAQSVVAT